MGKIDLGRRPYDQKKHGLLRGPDPEGCDAVGAVCRYWRQFTDLCVIDISCIVILKAIAEV